MEHIRENMFFVVTGVIVLLCVVFYFNPFFSVHSLEGENAKLEKDVRVLEGQLEDWLAVRVKVESVQNGKTLEKTLEGWVENEDANSVTVRTRTSTEKILRADIKTIEPKEFIPNASALKAADDYQKRYETMFKGKEEGGQKVMEGVKDLFAKMVLPTLLPEFKQSEQDNPQVFLNSYEQLINKLKADLQGKGIKSDAGSWYFWNWGTSLPFSKEQRDEATREYYLTKEVMGVIAEKGLNVYSLNRLEVDPRTEKNDKYTEASRNWGRRGDYFDTIPFELEVKMQFQSFPKLVGKILTMSTPVNIETVEISRLTDEERAAVKGREATGAVLVKVKLMCYALNYREVTAGPEVGMPSRVPGTSGGPVPPVRKFGG